MKEYEGNWSVEPGVGRRQDTEVVLFDLSLLCGTLVFGAMGVFLCPAWESLGVMRDVGGVEVVHFNNVGVGISWELAVYMWASGLEQFPCIPEVGKMLWVPRQTRAALLSTSIWKLERGEWLATIYHPGFHQEFGFTQEQVTTKLPSISSAVETFGVYRSQQTVCAHTHVPSSQFCLSP